MRARAAAVLFAALAAASAGAQVYKWVDDKGRTHYGEKPPDGVKATEVGVSSPTGTVTAPQPNMQNVRERELELRNQRLDREQKEQARQREAAGREQRCAAARRQLSTLQEQIRVYDRNEKGERVYLEDRDRPAAIAAQQKKVDENCR